VLPEEPKAKPGDIYQLGKHRLMCGDSTKLEDIQKLMGGEMADMVSQTRRTTWITRGYKRSSKDPERQHG